MFMIFLQKFRSMGLVIFCDIYEEIENSETLPQDVITLGF